MPSMTPRSDLFARLERLLHRETHAARRGHRDLMALPLDERVERGDSLAGLRFVAEEDGGRIRLACADNQAKFRTGDPLVLWNGDDHGRSPGARGPGIAVDYESYDEGRGEVVVVRDRYRREGRFDPSGVLQLDPRNGSLADLALDTLAELRTRSGPEADSARGVLERIAVVVEREAPGGLSGAASVPADLDASKREAFAAVFSRDPVCLVQGPPGSGKTFLLAHVVAALARRGERVLVTAHTHRAVNNALRTIAEVAPDLRVIKAGRATGADDLRGSPVETVSSIRRIPRGGDRPIISGTTVFGLRAAWDEPPWDRVVIDEAAQVPLAYAPGALMLAPRYMLVGDHRQLGPIVQGNHEDPLAATSIFEHLAEAYPPVLLRTTYRMNSGINAFPSRAFYGGALEPAANAARRRFARVPGGPFDAFFDPDRPAVLGLLEHEGFRTRCEPEARLVAALATDLLVRQGLKREALAVVSPYRAQLRLIRTLVRRGIVAALGRPSRLPVIDTVDRIQGQEREVVVVSLCASDTEWLASDQAEFFFAPNRLNVTLTRARTKLVVLASRHVFEAFPRRLDHLYRAEIFRDMARTLPSIEIRGQQP